MPNTASPFGFSPVRQTLPPSRYVIKAADPFAYRVGDAVKSANDADATGVGAVTLANGAEAVRGVIVAVEPAAPSNGLYGLVRLQVPAVKLADYYVWVLDDPDAQYTIQDDGVVPANLVAASVGRLANYLPNAAAAGVAGSDGSAAVLSSAAIASGAVCRLLGLVSGSGFGAFAIWRVKFALHELAIDLASNLGVPSPEAADRALVPSDNGKNLICAGARTFAVPLGAVPGFGVSADGPVTFAGPAAVVDSRTSGATAPTCVLQQRGADSYRVVGSKA